MIVLLLIGMLLAFAGCTAQAQSGDPCDAYSEMAGQCGGNIVSRYTRRYLALKSGKPHFLEEVEVDADGKPIMIPCAVEAESRATRGG
jgi:hypothetical protein